jgi:uroporphyrinogen III methyltransferase/synthase
VALVRGGTTVEQRAIVTTLEEFPAQYRNSRGMGDEASTLLIVGEVVTQRERLSWFESKPLFGWRVLVPRTREKPGPVSSYLVGYGAVPIEVATIAVEKPRTPHQMDRAVTGLVNGRYQWVVFTSANSVKAVREKFGEYGLDARAFAGLKIAAMDDETMESLHDSGVHPDLMPKGEQSSAGLLEVWQDHAGSADPINKVFVPRADIATDALVDGLKSRGWDVEDITAYRTVRAAPPPIETREAIKSGGFDAVVFTSSSTVRNLVGLAGKPHASTVVAVIGPQTAKTAEEYGLQVTIVADEPTESSLADALAMYASEHQPMRQGSE